jgi:hypothetical protein
MSDSWETRFAELIFEGGGGHTLSYTGEDLGASYTGYQDNFAWDALRLSAGDSLTLADGDAAPGGALYVTLLDLDGGLGQIASLVGNGMSLYYDPSDAGNAYLDGQRYSLAGGGVVAPVPEPGTGLMLGLGLAGLALRGGRVRKQAQR